MDGMTTTGKDLRDERERAGLSQAEMARRMGRHKMTVWRWEGQAIVNEQSASEYRAALEGARA